MVLTGDLRFGFYSSEVLRPERGDGASQLQVGGVPSIGMETGGSVMHQLLCFNLIRHMALWVSGTALSVILFTSQLLMVVWTVVFR